MTRVTLGQRQTPTEVTAICPLCGKRAGVMGSTGQRGTKLGVWVVCDHCNFNGEMEIDAPA